jgi:ribosomal RNA-processing protein 12
LLEVLKDHIQNAELQFFGTAILSAANFAKERSVELAKSNHPNESKAFEALQYNIWSLFPSFCNKPKDLATVCSPASQACSTFFSLFILIFYFSSLQNFRHLAKTLGTAINNEPDLRSVVINGLQVLLDTNWTDSQSEDVEVKNAAAVNIRELASFAKNFLPIFFNIYSSTPAEKRGFVLDVIAAYVRISDKKVNPFSLFFLILSHLLNF